MAKLSITERIAQLEVRKQALKARLTKHERAVDTRRKVLLGAMLLDAVERGGSGREPVADREFSATLTDWVRRELPGFLTRPIDRTLFPEFIDEHAEPARNYVPIAAGFGNRSLSLSGMTDRTMMLHGTRPRDD